MQIWKKNDFHEETNQSKEIMLQTETKINLRSQSTL